VAELQSFGAAARSLDTSQPSISRAVASVERSLGVELFERSTRRVRLTDAGREFTARVAVVVDELDHAVEHVRAARPGRGTTRLSIACLPSISHALLAGTLRRMAGDVPQQVQCVELLQGQLEDHVLAGRAEFGIADLAGVPDGLTTEPLWSEDAHVCAPTGHPLAEREDVTLIDVADHPLVGFPRDARLQAHLSEALAAIGRRRTPRILVQQYDTLLSLVAGGHGIAVVPGSVITRLPAGVEFRPITGVRLRRRVGVLHRSGRSPSRLMRSFVANLTAEATTHPGITTIPPRRTGSHVPRPRHGTGLAL
jgi:DNA-binding transcriptional LysR family regulator